MQYIRVFAACAVLMTPVAAQAQGSDWTGLYAGAQLDFADVELEVPGGGTTTADGDGLMYGLSGGYRQDLGQVVLGAAASLSFGNFDTPPVGGGGGDASFGSLATVGVEVGYDLGEFLVYGELGHTWATRSDAGDRRRYEGGVQYGIGADYMLNEQIMIGGGISRIDLDDFGGSDVTVTTFGARAAFRF
ncbi:outer membrane beta-barrel protein [Gymnodinialimonas ulvae]|uniref:outer membrane beta-barrel protein n=1 Tax=Gymnodinialimonas ulvae TaxID=3126504 RepID=UPI0030ACC813